MDQSSHVSLPPAPASIHFMGVGGIGVSGLARILLERGYRVSGCDLAPSRLTDALAALGATIHQGHDPAHLDGADLLVMSAAVRADNPERAAAEVRGVPTVKRAALLGLLLEGYRTIAVAGTHGKTTTSALIAAILLDAGLDPTAFVGGEVPALGDAAGPRNARSGRGDWAVAEADEYDASFLRLSPSVAVVLNVEADHLDFYGDLGGVKDAFAAFIARTDPDGALIACADDPIAMKLVASAPYRVVTYGLAREQDGQETGSAGFQPAPSSRAAQGRQDAGAPSGTIPALSGEHAGDRQDAGGPREPDWTAHDLSFDAAGARFVVRTPGGESLTVRTRLGGRHNVSNALAALASCAEAGVSPRAAARTLERFEPPRRRQEVKGHAAGGALVLDDYAHHHSEIRATLAGLRARYPGRRLRVAFQPHTYSRTKAFLAATGASFGDADEVAVAEIYAARERDTLGVSGRDVVDAARAAGVRATLTPTLDDVAAWLARDDAPDVVLVTMGAGDIWAAGEKIVISHQHPAANSWLDADD